MEWTTTFMVPFRQEVWLRAWCAAMSIPQAETKTGTATYMADQCLEAFDSRFSEKEEEE